MKLVKAKEGRKKIGNDCIFSISKLKDNEECMKMKKSNENLNGKQHRT